MTTSSKRSLDSRLVSASCWADNRSSAIRPRTGSRPQQRGRRGTRARGIPGSSSTAADPLFGDSAAAAVTPAPTQRHDRHHPLRCANSCHERLPGVTPAGPAECLSTVKSQHNSLSLYRSHDRRGSRGAIAFGPDRPPTRKVLPDSPVYQCTARRGEWDQPESAPGPLAHRGSSRFLWITATTCADSTKDPHCSARDGPAGVHGCPSHDQYPSTPNRPAKRREKEADLHPHPGGRSMSATTIFSRHARTDGQPVNRLVGWRWRTRLALLSWSSVLLVLGGCGPLKNWYHNGFKVGPNTVVRPLRWPTPGSTRTTSTSGANCLTIRRGGKSSTIRDSMNWCGRPTNRT